MERLTMSLESDLAKLFDEYIRDHGYTNRSEAMRDLIRKRLEHEKLQGPDDGHCVGILSYIYNHHELELASRVTKLHHQQHELNLASVHVHLDHDNCMEVAIVRGKISEVREFANEVIAERGVRHGKLNLVPIDYVETEDADGKRHSHSHPLT